MGLGMANQIKPMLLQQCLCLAWHLVLGCTIHQHWNNSKEATKQNSLDPQACFLANHSSLLKAPPVALRTLDSELRAHSKTMASDWDWQKLSFVLEAQGKLQDDELTKAQSKNNSALVSSLQAGFSLFETNLQNDQLQHRRHLLASSGDEAKARAAMVASLEVQGYWNWFFLG